MYIFVVSDHSMCIIFNLTYVQMCTLGQSPMDKNVLLWGLRHSKFKIDSVTLIAFQQFTRLIEQLVHHPHKYASDPGWHSQL